MTDWSCYPFEYYRLYCLWRAAENEIQEARDRRMDVVIRSFLK